MSEFDFDRIVDAFKDALSDNKLSISEVLKLVMLVLASLSSLLNLFGVSM